MFCHNYCLKTYKHKNKIKGESLLQNAMNHNQIMRGSVFDSDQRIQYYPLLTRSNQHSRISHIQHLTWRQDQHPWNKNNLASHRFSKSTESPNALPDNLCRAWYWTRTRSSNSHPHNDVYVHGPSNAKRPRSENFGVWPFHRKFYWASIYQNEMILKSCWYWGFLFVTSKKW